MEELRAISPIDGRYYKKIEPLSDYFSEFALIKKRLYVELMYLKEIDKGNYLELHDNFDLKEAKKVKEIEKITNHDIKAIEYYIKERVPEKSREFVHFGLTSEDISNLAYNLLIKEFLEKELNKKIQEITSFLFEKSLEWKSMPFLARTHGQPASPSTLGKEYFVFYTRISEQLEKLKKIKLKGKINGATGNYNALHLAMPEIDWIGFSKNFISKLGLDYNLITTQVEPKDTLVELFQCIKRINNILLDMDQDTWYYISLDYFTLIRKESETGSSTMPHKVNPIDFENSEGNIKIANSLLSSFESFQISRMQRDLSDSTMLRNIGVAFSHTYLSYISTLNGLKKLNPNIKEMKLDLESHPEILSEGVQTVLRKLGVKNPYESLKKISRGKKITTSEIREFINGLDIDKKEKTRLINLNQEDYIGLSERLVK